MGGRTQVFVYAADPMSASGAKTQLMNQPEIELVGPADIDRARVALVIADAADGSAARVVAAIQRDGIQRVVLVASRFDESGVVEATAAGVTSFLRRCEATSAKLVAVIREADQAGCRLPEGLQLKAARARAQMVVGLGDQTGPATGAATGGVSTLTDPALTAREAEVLKLVADGYDTNEIADLLAYSESTIKGVMAKILVRLGARNRCHAIAIAARDGLI